jgi:hypothetical protein
MRTVCWRRWPAPEARAVRTLTLTRLLLVRHGVEDCLERRCGVPRRSDIPLSETGKRQAQLTGRSLASEGVTALLSSPLVQRAGDGRGHGSGDWSSCGD